MHNIKLSMSIANPSDDGILSVTDLDFDGLMQLNSELSRPVKEFNDNGCTLNEVNEFLNSFGLGCLFDNIIKDDGYMLIEAYPYIRIYINKYMKKQTNFYDKKHIKTYSVFNVCNRCMRKLNLYYNNRTIGTNSIMSIGLFEKSLLCCHNCACESKRFKEDREFRDLVLGSDFAVYLNYKGE